MQPGVTHVLGLILSYPPGEEKFFHRVPLAYLAYKDLRTLSVHIFIFSAFSKLTLAVKNHTPYHPFFRPAQKRILTFLVTFGALAFF